MKGGYRISRDVDMVTNDSDYYLHTHPDKHEILLFLDGACEFHVEGRVYQLAPYDMVVAATNELHRIVHTAPHRYERCILELDTDFFAKNNCIQYAGVFENKLPGIGNFFDGEFVRREGIPAILERISAYTEEGEEPVAKGVLLELLYKLKRVTETEPSERHSSGYVRAAIAYINENLTSKLGMEELAEALHINSEYLGRLFKRQMKLSVKEYITYKRLLHVRTLYRTGKNLLEASLEAGFSNYSVFYRLYVKEFGQSPRNGMKKG